MIIIYKVVWLTYVLGRLLLNLPYIGLVNVIAGKKIMPEFIQREATAKNIAAGTLDFLRDPARYNAAIEDLRKVRAAIGERGASRRAAKVIADILKQ
jgi:lipid-A-disaccharide synthase